MAYSFGGTSTLQSGSTGVKAMTIPGRTQGGAAQQAQAASDESALGNPAYGLIIGILILVGLFFLRKASPYLEANVGGIGLIPLFMDTMKIIVGIVIVKMVFTKFQVPHFTPFVLSA